MDLTIFIAEDEKYFSQKLVELLRKWEEEHKVCLKIRVEKNLDYSVIEQIIDYDICFLDIQIKPVDGLSFANFLRQYNRNIQIVFQTNYSEFAIDAFGVNAHSYLKKPLVYDEICKCMCAIFQDIYSRSKEKVVFKMDAELYCVSLNEIIFMEANRHTTIIYTYADTYNVNEAFNSILKRLNSTVFFQTHRSYVVNLRHIAAVRETMVFTDTNKIIPISKKRLVNLKSEIIKFHTGNL